MNTSEDRIITPKRPSKRILALDGLRGLIVLSVMFLHAGIFPLGTVGVSVFFGLSGYLITGILLDGAASGAAPGEVLRAFYMHRALRILPLALLVALLVGVVTRAGWSTLWHVSFIQNWFPRHPAPRSLGHYWTLALQEQFYFLWPLVVLLVPLRRLPWICIGFLALGAIARAFVYSTESPLYTELFMRRATIVAADCIWAGALVAILARQGRLTALQGFVVPLLGTSIAALALLGIWMLEHRHPGSVYVFRETFLALAIGPAIVLIVSHPAKWLSHPVLRWIGSVSYGLYVIHGVLATWFWPVRSVPLRFILIFGLSFPLAALSWRYFESPILRQRRRWPMPTRPTGGPPVVVAASASGRSGPNIAL